MKPLTAALFLATALLLAGCSVGPTLADRQAYVQQHQERLTSRQASGILVGEVRAGMLPADVVAAYGRPTGKRQSTHSGLRVEVWYYEGLGQVVPQYVRFVDGRVTSTGDM